jgi:hypothetical protein
VSILLEKEMLFLYLLHNYPNLSELSIGIHATDENDEQENSLFCNEWDQNVLFHDGLDQALANIAPSF